MRNKLMIAIAIVAVLASSCEQALVDATDGIEGAPGSPTGAERNVGPALSDPSPGSGDGGSVRMLPIIKADRIRLVYALTRNGPEAGDLSEAIIRDAFEVRLEVTDVEIDRVEWHIDGILFRDDDLVAPYNIRYAGVLPIDGAFESDQGLGNSWQFQLRRNHKVKAIVHRGGGVTEIEAQFVIDAPKNAPTTTSAAAATTPSSTTTMAPATTTVAPVETTVTTTAPSVPVSGDAESSWAAPAGWENYALVSVPVSGGTLHLDSGSDALLVMPSEPVRRSTKIVGGHNVVVIGGEIDIDTDGGSNNTNMGLRFSGQTGTVYAEGIWMHGSHLNEGFQFESPQADAILRNNRIEDLKGGQTGGLNHADLVQPWGGLASLRIDGLTGSSRYQGLMLKADFSGPLGPVFLRRVNISMVEGATADEMFPANGGRYSIWLDPGSGTSTVEFDSETVWVDTNSQYKGGDLSQTVWPHTSVTGTDGLGSWIDMNAAGMTGRVRAGTPPDGDYVPLGSAGRGYSS